MQRRQSEIIYAADQRVLRDSSQLFAPPIYKLEHQTKIYFAGSDFAQPETKAKIIAVNLQHTFQQFITENE